MAVSAAVAETAALDVTMQSRQPSTILNFRFLRLANVTPSPPSINVVCLLGRQAKRKHMIARTSTLSLGEGGVADISKAKPYQSEVKYRRGGIAVLVYFGC